MAWLARSGWVGEAVVDPIVGVGRPIASSTVRDLDGFDLSSPPPTTRPVHIPSDTPQNIPTDRPIRHPFPPKKNTPRWTDLGKPHGERRPELPGPRVARRAERPRGPHVQLDGLPLVVVVEVVAVGVGLGVLGTGCVGVSYYVRACMPCVDVRSYTYLLLAMVAVRCGKR